jgi:hypothetical protein
MNDADRARFYGPGGDEWGDDGQDYELEPPDAEVLAAEGRRAKETMIESSLAVDVDEFYRELDSRHDIAFGRKTGDAKRFQFQIKHLLILTAVVAVVLTIVKLTGFSAMLMLVVLIVVGCVVAYMDFQQQRRWVEAQRRFEEKCERQRKFLESRFRPMQNRGGPATIYDDVPFGGSLPEAPSAPPRTQFRFQFSMWQLLAAMTFAAVVLGFVRVVGGPNNAATLLGFVALGGLLAHALGAEPPAIVVLGWWLTLAMYVLMSLGAAFLGALG